MQTQINVPAKSERGVPQQQWSTNTFQKDKSRQEILENRSSRLRWQILIYLSKELE